MANWFAFHPFALIALSSFGLALIAGFADWRRTRRRHIDRVGFMPWSFITVMAAMVTLFSAALAVQAGL